MFLECGNCRQRLTTSHAPPDARGVQCPHCGATVPIFDQNTLVSRGAPPPEPVAPAPPLQIEGYEILGCLGEGGMGIVYRARDPRLGRSIALKVVRNLPGMEALQERLTREAQAMAQLAHPNVVTVYDLSQALNHLEHLAIAATLILIGLVLGAWYVGLAHTRTPSTTGSSEKRPDRAVANDRR